MPNKAPRKTKKLNPIASAISDLAAGAFPGSNTKPARDNAPDVPKKAPAKKPVKAQKPKA